MKVYQFHSILSRQEYAYIAFNNALAGLKKDYTRLTEFLKYDMIKIQFSSGVSKVDYFQFIDALNMSQKEIMEYFKTWSAINVPKPKRKKKVS